ncbi:MAG: tRNA pseudouridine(38-40) synthase TruA [Bacteroidota bacterium]
MKFWEEKLFLQAGGMMAYRYFIKLAYQGTAYGGWQKQPNAITVQQSIENGLHTIAGIHGGITGCGRTDAGVHACVFYAHFDHAEAFSEEELLQLSQRLDRFLPQDIVIFGIKPVYPQVHARYSAVWREYEYLVIRHKDPFSFQHAYLVHGKLNVDLMNICAGMLLGKHDFECFSKTHTQVNNYLCEIKCAHWETREHELKFTIRADRFLRNMVRAIVGTLLDVGREKITANDFQLIIESHDRSRAGYSVPAKALTLSGIGYPEGIFSERPEHFVNEGGTKSIPLV